MWDVQREKGNIKRSGKGTDTADGEDGKVDRTEWGAVK